MTPTPSKIHRTGWAFSLAVLALLAGCASAPPPLTDFDDAAALVDRARAEDAPRYAPVEMRFAEEKLERARVAIESKDYDVAGQLSDQAEVDAELALAKTRQARARLAVEAKAAENDQLRRDLGGETP